MSWPETRTFLSTIRELLNVESVTIATHETGIDLAEQYGLSVSDGMIAAAALSANCDTLFSEDLQDGLLIRGRLRIINPFALTR
jgi:predicted nucleic acid-binding protein